jgi:hypothetical protein
VAAQGEPGWLAPVLAFGFAGLGAGGAAGRGAVGRGGRAKPVPLFGGEAGGADLVPFPGQAGFAAVLAGQYRNNVNVVLAMRTATQRTASSS